MTLPVSGEEGRGATSDGCVMSGDLDKQTDLDGFHEEGLHFSLVA